MTTTCFIRTIFIRMGKLKFTFTNIFLWLGVLASALLIENVAFLTDNPTGPLSDKYFYMFFVVAMIAYIGLYFFEHIFNKMKVDLLLIAVLGIFLGGGLVSIWLFKEMTFESTSGIITLDYSLSEKIRLSIAFFTFVLTVYTLLFVFSKNTITGRAMLWVYIILILVGYASIIYSLIKEFDQYQRLFTGDSLNISVKSFFWNSNMFAGNLLMAICASMILNSYKPNIFSPISAFIFGFIIVLTCSLTSIIIAAIVVPLYFIASLVSDYKKHPRFNFFLVGFYIVFATTMLCLYAVAIEGKMGPISYFFMRVHKEIENTNYSTFSSRVPIWEGAISLLKQDPIKLAFGYGFGINKDVISNWAISTGHGHIASTHNGAIQVFFNYGIVGVSVYGLFLLYFLYSLIRLFKKHKYFSFIFLLSGLCMLGYAVGESVIFYNSNVQGLIVGTLFYLPAIMAYRHERKKDVVISVKTRPYSWASMKDSLVVKTVAITILSIICALVPFIFSNLVKENEFYYKTLLTVIFSLVAAWLTLPYLFYLWHNDTTLKHFRIRAILNLFFLALFIAGSVGAYYILRRDIEGSYIYYFPIAVFVINLIDIAIYSAIKKPSFKVCLSTFVALFKTSIIGVITSLSASLV